MINFEFSQLTGEIEICNFLYSFRAAIKKTVPIFLIRKEDGDFFNSLRLHHFSLINFEFSQLTGEIEICDFLYSFRHVKIL
jgi:hypothetical protein